MTTNQTIDGVPRELLEAFAAYVADSPNAIMRARTKELRALLDAPVVEDPIPQYFAEACDKFDWAPEEALRFYADGKHFDAVNGRTRILCTGAIASHALKGMGEGYAAMKGVVPAARPHGEPAAWMQPGEDAMCISNKVKLHSLKVGGAPAQAVTVYSIPLYAEQPAPVAVAPDRDSLRDIIAQAIGGDTYDCVRVWSAWGVGTMSKDDFVPVVEQEARLYEIADACLDELKRLNPSL